MHSFPVIQFCVRHATDAASTRTFEGVLVVVGRSLQADIRVFGGPVSRRHLVFRHDSGAWTVTNGGRRLSVVRNRSHMGIGATEPVRAGDVFQVGAEWRIDVCAVETEALEDWTEKERSARGADALMLRIDRHGRASEWIAFDRAPVVVGRSRFADVVVEGFEVSRRHARIAPHESGWSIEHAGTKLPTTVNGVEVPASTKSFLHDGDVVELGPARLLVRLQESPAASARDPAAGSVATSGNDELDSSAPDSSAGSPDGDAGRWPSTILESRPHRWMESHGESQVGAERAKHAETETGEQADLFSPEVDAEAPVPGPDPDSVPPTMAGRIPAWGASDRDGMESAEPDRDSSDTQPLFLDGDATSEVEDDALGLREVGRRGRSGGAGVGRQETDGSELDEDDPVGSSRRRSEPDDLPETSFGGVPAPVPSGTSREPVRLVAGALIDGRYRADRRISSSVHSDTWAATDLESAAAVSLYEVAGAALPAADVRSRFVADLHRASRATHAGIERIHSVRDAGSQVLVVADRSADRTLRDEIEQRKRDGARFTPDEAARIACTIIEALAAAGPDLVHGDLSPESIRLATDGSLRVAGLGWRVAVHDALRRGARSRGPYAAPEVPDGPMDGRADQFALAVVLWELISGRSPAAGSITGSDLAEAPWGWRRAIDRALSTPPAARFPTWEEFRREISTPGDGGGWLSRLFSQRRASSR